MKKLLILLSFLPFAGISQTQTSYKSKYKNSTVYAGIDIGSKGVKLSVLEVGRNQKTGNFSIIQESSVNTDFINFTQPSFNATLNGMQQLYERAKNDFNVPTGRVFTVVSSGVKGQAEKEHKQDWVQNLIDSFRLRINDPSRDVPVIDVAQEARLSHLGIVPDARRYNTFLIDIGSGNTKGGYFPAGNLSEFKLFNVNWGTRSIVNATERRTEDDKTISNFNKQLYRVLAGDPNTEIVYAVNASGAYNMSDNIAMSGGISWAVATLMYPELYDNSVVPVTYNELVAFSEKLANKYGSLSDSAIVASIKDPSIDKATVAKDVKAVNLVFDQRSMMAGTGLLLRIMRQFEGVDKKQFYFVKNGQVGWISAYVDQSVSR